MEEMHQLIKQTSKRLELNSTISAKAIQLFNKASEHDLLTSTRIKDENIALASIYVAARLEDDPLEQDEITFNFNISPATLRKVYILICQALNIPREKIVSPQHLRHS